MIFGCLPRQTHEAAEQSAAATAAGWAILAEYGEQCRHLDAEFSRLRAFGDRAYLALTLR
jgi:hypothetical protein